MKKLIMLILSGVSAIVLSGCGGGSSDTGITSVDILDLYRGYVVTGFNDNNDIVELEFCGNLYDEYINYTHNFSGTYEVNDVYLDFSSGDYIDTYPTDYNLVVGDIYTLYNSIDHYLDSLEVTSIELINCPI